MLIKEEATHDTMKKSIKTQNINFNNSWTMSSAFGKSLKLFNLRHKVHHL